MMTERRTSRRRRRRSSSLPQQLRLFFVLVASAVVVLVCSPAAAAMAENAEYVPSSKTTLEIAFTRAFNRAISNGDWNEIFEDYDEIRKDSFCTGDPDEWILPKAISEGSDLENVVKRGTFKCGTVRGANFATSSGEVLLQTTDSITNGTTSTTTTTTKGSIVDWWDVLAEYVGSTMGTKIQIEWIAYESSQAALEALEMGQIDAGCGYWAPDGVYLTTTETKTDSLSPSSSSNSDGGSTDGQSNKDNNKQVVAVARGAAFSMQWCPTFLQVNYLYTDATSGAIENFDELIAFMNFGINNIDEDSSSVTAASQATTTTTTTTFTICVNAFPDAGLVTSCQNMFNAYALGNVKCKGVAGTGGSGGGDAFTMVLNGECIAAYSGGHPDDESSTGDSFYKFPQPNLFPAVSFFRRNDIQNFEEKAYSNKPTSLQLAVTRAFDDLIASGTYTEMFGNLADREPLSFCSGNSNNNDDVWPIPQSIGDNNDEEDSDLAAVMKRQVFRCGFGKDSYLTAPSKEQDNPNQVVLIDTRGDDESATGIFVDYWRLLLNKVSSYYGKEDGFVEVEWVEYGSGQEVLDALHAGKIDSACAYFSPDATWRLGSNNDDEEDTTRIARGLGFSQLFCPVYAEKGYIYTLDYFDNAINSFDELVTLVNNGAITTVCAVGGSAGSACAKTFTLYATAPVKCVMKGSEEAFALLATGECPAVFAASTHDVGNSFKRFEQPYHPTPVSLFRNFDVANQDTTSSSSLRRGGTVVIIPVLSWLLLAALNFF